MLEASIVLVIFAVLLWIPVFVWAITTAAREGAMAISVVLLFFPIAPLGIAIIEFEKTKWPFMCWIASTAFSILGVMLLPFD